ncbi:MAG: DUF1501 domain-containing protein, partial [Planctomycetota bacterium]|nr:DUF1501 domain-containing protein [Planctomycetota bacterium]
MATYSHANNCPGRNPIPFSRRAWLQQSANGFGTIALASLLADQSEAAQVAGHRIAKAKNVIFCFMDGGVSHVDSFDPKPELDRRDGEPAGEIDNPTANKDRKWLKSPWSFKQHGESGTVVSSLFPHIAGVVDDIAVIRSMKADLPIHSTGVMLMHTGSNNSGRPSMGAWSNYGLGSENRNLPG